MSHSHGLTPRIRGRLLDAISRETGWGPSDRDPLYMALDRVKDGLLTVRDDYASDYDEAQWTDDEVVDSALDYFGL